MTRGCRVKEAYWYLATPYSKYPKGLDAAFIEASKAAGFLVAQGFRVYSPIVHCHPIAIHSGIDPLSHEIWLAADAPFMHGAAGLIVVEMVGWKDSFGIKEEIEFFEGEGKPILRMEWNDER